MDVAVYDSAGLLTQIVVLFERVSHQFVVFVAVEFDFPSEKHLEEARTGEEGISGYYLFLEVAIQLLCRVLQVQQFFACRLLHQ